MQFFPAEMHGTVNKYEEDTLVFKSMIKQGPFFWLVRVHVLIFARQPTNF